jgi:enamine deaminase RidA (YjgF/YER057c/UK114 family)
MAVEKFGTRRYAGGVVHAPFVRAGKWVFGTGLRATLADGSTDGEILRPGRPLGLAPQPQREAAAIFAGMAHHLHVASSSLSRIARLDQYYPDPRSVDPYHAARKNVLAGQVSPSTSVIVNRLLNLDTSMDLQVIAATQASGYSVQQAPPGGLNVPATSGYTPHVRVGNLVFVAGQLARNGTGQLAAEAQVPDGQQWNGTRIQLETEYLVQHRLVPALSHAGSRLGLVLKAQVYLSHPEDLPVFWASWCKAFAERVPPTTVVPVRHPAFGTRAATIEVNLVAAHESAADQVRDIDCDVELIGGDMLPARAFDGLLFVAGLMGIEDGGVCAAALPDPAVPFYQDSAGAQMEDILCKAEKIFAAAGSDLSQVMRALHFHTDLRDFRACWQAWNPALRAEGLPFSAVEVAQDMFAPGARVILDLWGHVPD